MKKIYSLFVALFFSASVFAAGHVVTITQTNVTCYGICDGSATASVSGGVGPFTYSWSPISATTASISGLCPGTYVVTCTDNSDMSTANANVTITEPPLLTVGLGGATICSGSCTTLSPLASGGTPPYTYSWTGGLFGPSPSACPATTTTYTVTVTDANGCVAMGSSTVTVNPIPVVTANSPTICAGLTATLTGGGASTYLWSTGAATATINVSPATTTSYTVTGTSAGCTATAVSTVTVNPSPTITVPTPYDVCPGTCVGLTATATGGSAFVWTPATGLSSTTIANPISCPSTTTSYTVTAMLSGCTATATTTVIVNPSITTTTTSVNATGCVSCDGTATTSPAGGTMPYIYLWSDPMAQTTATATSLCAGTYSVTITDMAGCTTTDSTTIYSASDLIANFTMVPDSTNAYNFLGYNTSTGAGNSYAWDFGDGAVSTMASPTHTYALAGTYNVCLIASNFLCGADTLCQSVTVTGVLDPCNALFNIADDTINPDPNAHYVYNLSYGATLSYLWDFGDGTTSTLATPSHVYASTGPYLLCLSIDNGSGCTDMFCDSLISADSLNRSSGTMQLVVYDVPTFYSVATGIANAIATDNVKVAPNPFNESTIFTVNSNEVYSFELTDVLGKKVKSKNGISEKQFEISRNGLENGIYFYKIYTSESVIGIGKVVIK